MLLSMLYCCFRHCSCSYHAAPAAAVAAATATIAPAAAAAVAPTVATTIVPAIHQTLLRKNRTENVPVAVGAGTPLPAT